jgi:UDP-N-acetylglucosamine transferase subunit ALG13
MILFTLGTNEQPFDRLARAAAELEIEEQLVVQHGASNVPPGPGEWIDFLPFDELEARVRQARLVVCHAGVGSIILAHRCGQRPIVVPRRLSLGEAVDDHQVALGERLAGRRLVTLIEDESLLADAIRAGADAGSLGALNDGLAGASALARDLRSKLDSLLVARP